MSDFIQVGTLVIAKADIVALEKFESCGKFKVRLYINCSKLKDGYFQWGFAKSSEQEEIYNFIYKEWTNSD